MRLIKLLTKSSQLMLLHLSFLLIALGGVTTWLTARESRVALVPGIPVERCGVNIELLRFQTEYYPGGDVPRDYVSYLLVNGVEMTVSVNRPLAVGGCRIYQQGYTPEGCSIVSIRKDASGTALTFTGFALFFIGGLLSLFRRRRGVAVAIVVAAFSTLTVSASDLPTVSKAEADSLARTQVVYRGRVTTFSTVAHDFMKKVHGEKYFCGLSAERAVASIWKFPEQWSDATMIKVGAEYRSFAEFFDERGRYLAPGDASVDERVGLMLLLRSNQLFSEPGEADARLSAAQVEGEIVYNTLSLTLIAFVLLFIAAVTAFFSSKWGRIVGWVAFLFQLTVILFESWLSGRGPFASMFETLQFLAAAVALISLLIRGLRGVGLLVSGCMALVAHLQAMNPIVTPLMPVLHSPWLSLHVSLVMTSYAIFVVVAILALQTRGGDNRCRQLLRVAVYLLGLGICTGAVWANESWGRYWGWDPKETWALITFLIYCVPLHMRRPSRWWYVVPLLSVAMTYFGVNYMQSLHSYG